MARTPSLRGTPCFILCARIQLMTPIMVHQLCGRCAEFCCASSILYINYWHQGVQPTKYSQLCQLLGLSPQACGMDSSMKWILLSFFICGATVFTEYLGPRVQAGKRGMCPGSGMELDILTEGPHSTFSLSSLCSLF